MTAPAELLRDPARWDPLAALAAARHAREVYRAPHEYGRRVMDWGWAAGTIISEGAAQVGIAWCPEVILVTYRGSHQVGDFAHDAASLWRVRWPPYLPPAARIGWGFRRQTQALEEPVLDWVTRLCGRYSSAQIVVAGHSLGATLATTGTVMLRHHRIPVRCCWALEAPRTGNASWADFYDNQIRPWTPTWRLANTDRGTPDLVTRVPKKRWGFRHHGRVVTLLPNAAILGETAWQDYRRLNPVGTWQAMRVITNLGRGVSAHLADNLVRRLEAHVELEAAAERRAS